MIGAQLSICVAVAPPADPTDQIVPVRWSKGEGRHELQLRFSRECHQDEEWIDRIRRRLATLRSPLLGDRPHIFSVVEDLLVLYVICRVERRLNAEKKLWIPNVLSQELRHARCKPKQLRKHALVRIDQRIAGIEDVKRDVAVVCVDDGLHAIAHVVHGLISNGDVRRKETEQEWKPDP